MSKAYDFYRTPSQEEIEEQERLEYLEWYNQQKEKENETDSSRMVRKRN